MKQKRFVRTDVSSRGAKFEMLLLGRCAIFKEPPPWIAKIPGLHKIARDQPKNWDPLNPSTLWASKFLNDVRACLPKFLRNEVRLCVSLGTEIDFWHGIDAFMHLRGRFVTLDVTTQFEDLDIEPTHRVDEIFYRDALYANWEERCMRVAKKLYPPLSKDASSEK